MSRTSEYEAPRLTTYGELKQLTKMTGSTEQISGRDEIMKAFFKRIVDAFESLKRSRNGYDPELKMTLTELKSRITIAFDWGKIVAEFNTSGLNRDYYKDPTVLQLLINDLERIIFGTEPEDEAYRQEIIAKLHKQENARRDIEKWEREHPGEVAELMNRFTVGLKQLLNDARDSSIDNV